jgi:hypothetical protein
VSPTILRERGFRVLVYSNEESRIHVHVFCANGQAKFWLEPNVELAENYGLRSGEIGKAQRLIEEHYDEITRRWQEHFGT